MACSTYFRVRMPRPESTFNAPIASLSRSVGVKRDTKRTLEESRVESRYLGAKREADRDFHASSTLSVTDSLQIELFSEAFSNGE